MSWGLDNQKTLTIGYIAGAIYAGQMIFIPSKYLEMDGQRATSDATSLCRGVGGGIAGLSLTAYLSKNGSKDAQDAIIKGMCCAMTVWGFNNLLRLMDRGSTQAKIDTLTTLVLGGIFAAACKN